MVFNVAVEGAVGMIPLVGDLFDAGWKANQRNTRLLDTYLQNPRKARASGRAFAVGMISLMVVLLIATGVVAFLVFRWAWQCLTPNSPRVIIYTRLNRTMRFELVPPSLFFTPHKFDVLVNT